MYVICAALITLERFSSLGGVASELGLKFGDVVVSQQGASEIYFCWLSGLDRQRSFSLVTLL
jgi:hypothetical protein